MKKLKLIADISLTDEAHSKYKITHKSFLKNIATNLARKMCEQQKSNFFSISTEIHGKFVHFRRSCKISG